MGVATAGLAVAQLAGIPLGSYLAVFSWRYSFFAISIASLLLLILLYFFFPSVKSHGSLKKNVIGSYVAIFKHKRLRRYFIGYLFFQTGNFEAISFFGSWLNKSYGFNEISIGKSMVVIGIGNIIGAIYGTKLVKNFGIYRSLSLSFIVLILLYIILPYPNISEVSVSLLSIIMMVAGAMFAVFMNILQSQLTTSLGTVSALANSFMYLGTLIGGVVGGILLKQFNGFYGNAFFTVIFYSISFLIFIFAGAFRKENFNHS